MQCFLFEIGLHCFKHALFLNLSELIELNLIFKMFSFRCWWKKRACHTQQPKFAENATKIENNNSMMAVEGREGRLTDWLGDWLKDCLKAWKNNISTLIMDNAAGGGMANDNDATNACCSYCCCCCHWWCCSSAP